MFSNNVANCLTLAGCLQVTGVVHQLLFPVFYLCIVAAIELLGPLTENNFEHPETLITILKCCLFVPGP